MGVEVVLVVAAVVVAIVVVLGMVGDVATWDSVDGVCWDSGCLWWGSGCGGSYGAGNKEFDDDDGVVLALLLELLMLDLVMEISVLILNFWHNSGGISRLREG